MVVSEDSPETGIPPMSMPEKGLLPEEMPLLEESIEKTPEATTPTSLKPDYMSTSSQYDRNICTKGQETRA